MDFLSSDQFMLHHYPDGWRLVRALSRGEGVSVETDAQVRAWADKVVVVRCRLRRQSCGRCAPDTCPALMEDRIHDFPQLGAVIMARQGRMLGLHAIKGAGYRPLLAAK